ncbi:MAG: WD40/YVTN/BNR-like repeat-containing protein [Terriglobales bacterium]
MKLAMAVVAAMSVAAVGQRFGRGPAGPQRAQTPAALHFDYLGPQPSGRIAAAAGVEGDPNTYYLGASSGGVWKSTDGGHTFKPVFDGEDALAIGALAVAPSDPNTVWAGTGEAWAIRDIDMMGDGIYKSSDAGATWTHLGLEKTGRIGRILVSPADVNTVYVCALGTTTGPQQDRGVFKTTDGGAHWQRVLFVNPWTGCSGLAMDAHDPNTLLAGTWQVLMHTWGEFSGTWPGYTGTPGSGVYISHDGGATWTHITEGMPKPPVGKIDVAIAPSDSQRMYALIQTADQGSLWRSDDGGVTWRDENWNRTLIGRAGYYIRIAVNPQNEDDVLVTNSGFHRSYNGGKTFDEPRPRPAPGAPRLDASCGDCHDIWMDPKIPGRYVLTDDGGASIATGHNVLSVRIPDGQMYHVALDNQVPYWVYTNRQDNGTMRGPSNGPEGTGNGVVPGVAQNPRAPGRGGRGGFGGRGEQAPAWQYALGGCESGFTIPDPKDPNIIWASCYGDEITRYDAREGIARSVSPWMHTLDSQPNLLKYRCHWTPPMAVDPFDGSVYYGCQVIFHTTDGGQSWKVISPDLSTHNPAHIVSSGGLVGDNLGQFYGDVVFAIAPSPVQRHLLWAGTNDGKLWYTRDGGANWVDVTSHIHGLPAEGTVVQISPSHFDPATAYVAFDLHLDNDTNPYLFKTTDFGQTWTRISDGLPHGNPLDYTRSIADNPNRKGMLFAGTGHGFFYSLNDGQSWAQFQKDLPQTAVTWITVEPRYHDVVVSTYGRGIYVLRNISLLEQTGETAPAADATRLYKPTAGFRMPRSGNAGFEFSLAAAPAAPLQFEIHDANGAVIRTFEAAGHAGLNRVTWDLRYEAPTQVALRSTPPDNPTIWQEPRFRGHDTRPVVHWGIEGAVRTGPIAAPGNYTVSVAVDGKTLSQPFTVLKDPAIEASDADLVASTKMQVRVRNDMNEAADMINRLEIVRRHVQDDTAQNKPRPELVSSLDGFQKKLLGVELQLLSHSSMQSDDKYYPEQYKVYMNLIWFNGEIGSGAGDVAGGADHRPTDVSYPILDGIEKQMATAKAGFNQLMNVDLAAFNREMAGKLPAITTQP